MIFDIKLSDLALITAGLGCLKQKTLEEKDKETTKKVDNVLDKIQLVYANLAYTMENMVNFELDFKEEGVDEQTDSD